MAAGGCVRLARGCAAGLILIGALAAPVAALDLGFGAALRLEAEDNPDLNPATDDAVSRAALRLTLDGVTETRSARLGFGLAGSLYGDLAGPGAVQQARLGDPFAYLDYARQGAGASLSLRASWREADLARGQTLDDFDEAAGIRSTATLDAGLTLFDDARAGLSLGARSEQVRYRDDGGAQTDYTRNRAEIGLRLDLTETARADLRLSYSVYEARGGDPRETWDLGAGLRIARSFGTASADLDLTRTEGGDRVSLRLGHSLEMPRGTQSFSFGAARGPSGTVQMVGSLDLQWQTPRGLLTAGLDRGFTSGESDDADVLRSRLAVGYRQELGPLDALRLDMSLAQNETLASGDTVTRAELGATWSRALTEDWSLDLSLRHRLRWQDPGTDGRSSAAVLELRRTFSARY